jgi:diguanylate cyclase (GGDEF)-like protein
MALGAGGFAAAWDCHPMTAVMVAGLLGFAIMQVCGTALLAQATRIQLLALAAPLAVTCVTQGLLRHGGMEEAAVGGVFAVWAAGAVPIADRSAARVKQLALAIADECQVASSRGRDVVVAPDVENFQRLLGRDQATGLPNRLSFARLLEQESARASRAEAPLSLILLGWDDYEKYVAWRTPQALDARLADIAKRLRATLRRQADMLGSLGVGRFGVILPATDAFGATIVARNMQEALGKPEADMPGGVAAAPLRASIGAASYRGKGPLPDTQLLEFAEAALRDARNAGGNRIRRYDPAVMALQPAAAKTKVNQDTPQDRDDTARPSLVAAITKDILGL